MKPHKTHTATLYRVYRMKIAKFRKPDSSFGFGQVVDNAIVPFIPTSEITSISDLLEVESPDEAAKSMLDSEDNKLDLAQVELLPPIDQQEVWAAGVTYIRSKSARMEESEAAASCYDRVYESARPEIFFKGNAHRSAGHQQEVRIRYDSEWNVPEPELTLVLNSKMKLVGYTIGNDMSSRDIEGDNPLYLPQAKVYDQCCGLGPWITLESGMPARDKIEINLDISRNNKSVFKGSTSVTQMARQFEELIHWLGRDQSFPHGAFLMTGTGIVPDSDFTLQHGDQISIEITGIGTLCQTVAAPSAR